MHLFITSSPCNDDVPAGVELPCIFFEKNRFVKNLKARVRPNARFVVVAADPDNYDLNDEMAETFANCFEYHGMMIESVEILDGRNWKMADELILGSDIVLLGGGHVPTENEFFAKMGLRRLLADYDGVVMGVSAGSMNCAEMVYAQPEMPGESEDPGYRRFMFGLGLADVMILPHYQKVRNMILDGKRLYEDITFEDSIDRAFIAMPDGSYILVEDGREVLYGEGYLVSEGAIRKICSDGEAIEL